MAAIAGRPTGSAVPAVPLLLRLYPAAWRERYGDEFAELLLARPPRLRDRVDIVLGAVDARLHPQVGRAATDPSAPRDRSAGALLVMAGALLTAWATLGASYAGRVGQPDDTEAQSVLAIASSTGTLGAFMLAIALLLLASRYDQWIGSAGAVGGVLTGAGLVFASFGGGLVALFMLGAGTVLLAVRIQGRLVGKVSAAVILAATLLAVGAFVAIAMNGWTDMTPFRLTVLYGPAWIMVGIDLKVPAARARLAAA